ncbi:DNA topoisomerase IB [Cognatishimia sp. MH4019]|uniref:DNA topoisomerase IB n=1 Tax=Cognatishimia sp. MH4019 TaxID=2854030 RepID=UPI001CD62BBD|nr:DNA topoisomerase IB [Cognatishimia sp. MH4019]
MNVPASIPGLTYYPDNRPGIARKRRGRGFSYIAPDGTRIEDATERKRLAAMAVPPAYEDVWMSPLPDGHLLATGRDAAKRKQYRYHPDWTAARSETKFDQLGAFGEVLPRIRRWITINLSEDIGAPQTALAATLALLDRGSLRPGHPEYSDENGSFGATTLQARHVDLIAGGVALDYTAKGGKRVQKTVPGAKLNRVLGRIMDLPGAELISWIDGQGEPRAVRSEMLNACLFELTDGIATAKTFRTWNGSHAALNVLLRKPDATITACAEAASERLHNTPAIARTGYIHPDILDLVGGDAAVLKRLEQRASRFANGLLRQGEAELRALLS